MGFFDNGILDTVGQLLDIFSSTWDGINYLLYSVGYYIIEMLDLFYQPFAGLFNACGTLMTVFIDVFTLCLSWTGDTFMWFVGLLVSMYIFFFAIKIFLLLKEIILRWI